MVDIEKVIRAVDSCFDYWLDKHGYLSQLELEHVRQIKADALALLKEQEAVEPRVSTAEQRCGHCNKVIEMDGWKVCPWCGKMIDWERWW